MSETRASEAWPLCAAVAAVTLLQSTAAMAQSPAIVAVEATVAQEQFLCRSPGTSDRLIGIYRAPDGLQRCRVDYTRDGKTRSLWKAGHNYAYCVRKAVQIVGLLEQVGFKCSPQTRETAGSAPVG